MLGNLIVGRALTSSEAGRSEVKVGVMRLGPSSATREVVLSGRSGLDVSGTIAVNVVGQVIAPLNAGGIGKVLPMLEGMFEIEIEMAVVVGRGLDSIVSRLWLVSEVFNELLVGLLALVTLSTVLGKLVGGLVKSVVIVVVLAGLPVELVANETLKILAETSIEVVTESKLDATTTDVSIAVEVGGRKIRLLLLPL